MDTLQGNLFELWSTSWYPLPSRLNPPRRGLSYGTRHPSYVPFTRSPLDVSLLLGLPRTSPRSGLRSRSNPQLRLRRWLMVVVPSGISVPSDSGSPSFPSIRPGRTSRTQRVPPSTPTDYSCNSVQSSDTCQRDPFLPMTGPQGSRWFTPPLVLIRVLSFRPELPTGPSSPVLGGKRPDPHVNGELG